MMNGNDERNTKLVISDPKKNKMFEEMKNKITLLIITWQHHIVFIYTYLGFAENNSQTTSRKYITYRMHYLVLVV